ncbi:Amino acid kinase family [Fragilaria crotonensis]|nr:Amino acid kinase family [Fragilaria crotonensis]
MIPTTHHKRLSFRITAPAVTLAVVLLSESFRSTVGFMPSPSFRYRPFQVSIPVASTSKDLQEQETVSSDGDATSIPKKSPLDEFDAQIIDPASIEFEHFSDESVNGDYGFVKCFVDLPITLPTIARQLPFTTFRRLVGKPEKFRDLMNDIALTWLLGMKIVLVAGCRHQIDKRVPNRTAVNGIYVTDKETLRVIKEEAGYVRFEVERQLARALRTHGTEMDGNVVSGNFFSAQPFGILMVSITSFLDLLGEWKLRRFDACIRRGMSAFDYTGCEPSGEVFNVNSESLAATVAGALGASKIIFFLEQQVRLKNKDFGNQVMSLRHSDASNLLKHHNIEIQKRGAVLVGRNEPSDDRGVEDMLIRIGWATSALDQGVKRAHLLAPTQGALLQELYTRDGSGTLVSRDIYEGIRRANVNDVVGIHELISPLIKMGTLVDRPKAVLEKDIENYYVYTRDNLVVACGQLKPFEDGFAEIGCLVVRNEYRSGGRGDSMLGYLERLCLRLGATKVFVLSTQTMEWFIERDFQQVEVDKLPPSRQATYNHERGSKIYMKLIDSDRELDASELWWNR